MSALFTRTAPIRMEVEPLREAFQFLGFNVGNQATDPDEFGFAEFCLVFRFDRKEARQIRLSTVKLPARGPALFRSLACDIFP